MILEKITQQELFTSSNRSTIKSQRDQNVKSLSLNHPLHTRFYFSIIISLTLIDVFIIWDMYYHYCQSVTHSLNCFRIGFKVFKKFSFPIWFTISLKFYKTNDYLQSPSKIMQWKFYHLERWGRHSCSSCRLCWLRGKCTNPGLLWTRSAGQDFEDHLLCSQILISTTCM